jgi:hypothetical protein
MDARHDSRAQQHGSYSHEGPSTRYGTAFAIGISLNLAFVLVIVLVVMLGTRWAGACRTVPG